MAEHFVGSASAESNIPRVNFAIGPYCPVRCEGCYNFFADTEREGGLVSAAEVVDFAGAISELGIKRAIISGGDPLSHPEIEEIFTGLSEVMDHRRADTVGTSLLDPETKIPILYKGRGFMPHYKAEQFKGIVSLMNIPMDGANQRTAEQFRRGRSNSLREAVEIAGKIKEADIPLGINTVVNRANVEELPEMHRIVRELGACQWRLFQFDPAGPNPAKHRDKLTLDADVFDSATDALRAEGGEVQIFAGGLNRRGTYCMVNDGGILYKRNGGQEELDVVGHITIDREMVMRSLAQHVAMFA